ncbi:MAG: hypothetical protein IKY85_05735 [Bacteroidaceae bacterium]|nr:hypothetical protein [Bacteroidaceae bacterium]
MWNKETVLERLKSNPHFHLLKEEYDGKFACGYEFDEVTVFIFNSVGGIYDAYFVNVTDTNVKSAQQFARIAIEILNEDKND